MAVRIAGLTAPPLSLKYRKRVVGGVPVIVGTQRRRDPGSVVLHVHGGGYFMGTARAFLPMSARLAAAVPANLVTVDYRLAPEHPYPAAIDDVVAVYLSVLETYPPDRIAMAGESAGGGAVLATLMRLRDEGHPLPACAYLMSPLTDLTASGESIITKAEIDPIATVEMIYDGVPFYLGDTPSSDPGVSPLFGDLAGLPPMLIQVGTDEILLSDSTRLADQVSALGGEAEIEIYEHLFHGFQVSAGVIPEANRAIGRGGDFIASRLSRT